ncbi:MAG: hypothetical protein K2W95_20125 [Candidatus Obscuribacterales bacterium]|nr:hypothetical protein [Candidatus Obscuribacterales bacterium]
MTRNPRWSRAAVLSLLILLGAPALKVAACGPSYPVLTFSYGVHPDLPLSKFAAGDLGIIDHGMARSYYVVAYRYLTGKPLSQVEQKAVVALWHLRLGEDDPELIGALKSWIEEQKRVLGLDAQKTLPYSDYALNSHYLNYQNCSADSFKFAVKNLHDIGKKFGDQSRELKEWTRAQNEVFCNCPFSYDKKAIIPNALPVSSPALLRAYRNYQIASANFYGDRFDKAIEQFNAIASDTRSPFKDLAPYLSVRTMIRKATLSDEINKDLLKEASSKLSQLVGTTQSTVVKSAAPLTNNYLKLQLNPVSWLPELGKTLSSTTLGGTFGNTLYYYTSAFDTVAGDNDCDYSDKNVLQKQFDKLPLSIRSDDMTNWIAVMRGEGANAVNESFNKWNSSKQPQWLIAALIKADAKSPQAQTLVSAASKIAKSSPAYLSVNRQVARILIETGKKTAARAKLDKLLRTPNLPPSSFNDLTNLRLRVCSNFAEFAKVALLAPAGVVDSMSGELPPEDFFKFEKLSKYPALRLAYEPDALYLFNYGTAIAQLQELLKDPRLPPALRIELLRSVWVRAILLNNSAVALSTAPALAKATPSMSATVNSWLSAKTPAERKLAMAYLMLRNPGMSPYIYPDYGRNTPVDKIDDYQNNWWPQKDEYGAEKENAPLKALLSSLEDCLTPVQRQAAAKENKALTAVGPAPDYLCSLALAAARDLPGDSRIPELLHLAVKSTRYGTTTGQTSELSKRCYQLLHRKYPSSSWAKKTKFWY